MSVQRHCARERLTSHPNILRSVHFQVRIDDTAKLARHHCSRPRLMLVSRHIRAHPGDKLRVRHLLRPRLELAQKRGGERRGSEHAPCEAHPGDMHRDVEWMCVVVRVKRRRRERGRARYMCASARERSVKHSADGCVCPVGTLGRKRGTGVRWA